ncbi:phylloplanin-like [Nicotiana tomentosiformis]|uniref:phylloplanin-like n=1 Tax=Nicotiana tomentosiformis TaxID=4098 RepID=UPI00051C6644|nr:phylloplanin-like [Nicotiana tomentosiformis]XP_016469229.1 PREDICTED: phylloplanin-like [Nicotiana tabacum]
MASTNIFLIFLLAALIVTPVVVAQLVSIRISGVVLCSVNGNLDVINGLTPQVFSNASVQLRCGTRNVVSSTITNGSGVFSLVVDPRVNTLLLLLLNCRLVVVTPLSTCNASLPSVGLLVSSLNLVNISNGGVGGLTNIGLGPTGFILNRNLIL